VWGAALVYALVTEPDAAGWIAFAILTGIGIVGLVAGTLLPHRRVVAAGVPRSSIVVGIVAGVVGLFAIPVVGLPIGAALGILVAEKSRVNDWSAAVTATRTLLVGFGLGALVQFLAGVAMMATWVVWVLID
jgi:hypothetical protein